MFTNEEIYAICHLIIKKGNYGYTDPLIEYFINNTISSEDRQRLGGSSHVALEKIRDLVLTEKYNTKVQVTKNRRYGK